MGKPATVSKLKDNQVSATAKYLRVPPRKARLVADAVRGKYVSDALAILKFVPNFAARALEKVIKSAVANAENGRPFDADGRPLPPLNTDNLKLVRANVDEGPRMKRFQPRAHGRAYRILKRMCHITVVLEEAEPKPRKPQRATGRRARAAARREVPAQVVTPAAEATATEAPVTEVAQVETPETVAPETPAAVEDTTPTTATETGETPGNEPEKAE